MTRPEKKARPGPRNRVAAAAAAAAPPAAAASSSARPSEPPAPPLAEPLPAQPLAPPPPGLVGYGQITDPVMCEILRDYRISTTVGSRLSTLSLVSQAAILSRLLYKRAQDDESFDGWLMKAIRRSDSNKLVHPRLTLDGEHVNV
ncbi:unnamed protein product [Cladocopium goreaui]|uniref:Uncharacterized protein n=1 Tax=Cladocopium goreaui TaxID=2562237 RepID=A0A9P1C0T9_9DINO|nr:unnamed protein product [Cladocopium goreaui]